MTVKDAKKLLLGLCIENMDRLIRDQVALNFFDKDYKRVLKASEELKGEFERRISNK